MKEVGFILRLNTFYINLSKPENILLDDQLNVKLCDFGWCTEDIENPRSTFCGTYEVKHDIISKFLIEF